MMDKEKQPMEILLNLLHLTHLNIQNFHVDTSGSFVYQEYGEIGFDHFLGKPSFGKGRPGSIRLIEKWKELTEKERTAVEMYCRLKNVPIRSYLIKAGVDKL